MLGLMSLMKASYDEGLSVHCALQVTSQSLAWDLATRLMHMHNYVPGQASLVNEPPKYHFKDHYLPGNKSKNSSNSFSTFPTPLMAPASVSSFVIKMSCHTCLQSRIFINFFLPGTFLVDFGMVAFTFFHPIEAMWMSSGSSRPSEQTVQLNLKKKNEPLRPQKLPCTLKVNSGQREQL